MTLPLPIFPSSTPRCPIHGNPAFNQFLLSFLVYAMSVHVHTLTLSINSYAIEVRLTSGFTWENRSEFRRVEKYYVIDVLETRTGQGEQFFHSHVVN